MTESDCPIGEECVGGTCATPRDGGGAVGAGEIEVAPTRLDFGSASLGVQVTHEFTITNVGDGALAVTRLEVIEEDDLAEYVATPSGLVSLELAPGESTAVTITLTQADAEDDLGELRISSDDASEPIVPVALVSQLKGPPRIRSLRPRRLLAAALRRGRQAAHHPEIRWPGVQPCYRVCYIQRNPQ